MYQKGRQEDVDIRVFNCVQRFIQIPRDSLRPFNSTIKVKRLCICRYPLVQFNMSHQPLAVHVINV